MLSLITMAGAIEVHLLGYYIVVFVLYNSVQVDMDINNFPFWDWGSFKRIFSLPWARLWSCKSCWNTTRHHISSSCKQISLRSSNLKCSEQNVVPRWTWTPFLRLHNIPETYEANGGRFLFHLVAFRETATLRHSKIKQTRPTMKQDFSGEAL